MSDTLTAEEILYGDMPTRSMAPMSFAAAGDLPGAEDMVSVGLGKNRHGMHPHTAFSWSAENMRIYEA